MGISQECAQKNGIIDNEIDRKAEISFCCVPTLVSWFVMTFRILLHKSFISKISFFYSPTTMKIHPQQNNNCIYIKYDYNKNRRKMYLATIQSPSV